MRTALTASFLLGMASIGTLACGDTAASGGGGGDEEGGSSSNSGGGGGASNPTTSSTMSAGGGGQGGSGGVPVFVAQGHMGRLMVSCDDGVTWVANQSADDGAQCWGENNLPDCDHSPWAGRGLAFGNGAFVATFGWGYNGVLRRSVDGATWEDVWTEQPTFADIAFGNGLFVANNSPSYVSTDGVTWDEGGDLGLDVYNVRAISFVPHDGGLFVITGESGSERDIVLSPDGVAWHHPTSRPAECGSYVLNIAYGAGTIAIFSGHGTVCTSDDGGDTWTLRTIAPYLTSPGVFTGTEFFVYEGATLHRSSDGERWTSQGITPSNVRIGALARSDAGTFVAHKDAWQGWYDEQEMYRSADGLTWERLGPGDFLGSHPINFIEFGYAEASSTCP